MQYHVAYLLLLLLINGAGCIWRYIVSNIATLKCVKHTDLSPYTLICPHTHTENVLVCVWGQISVLNTLLFLQCMPVLL